MADSVNFSSPEPTGAIVSQFYLALEKCFDMQDGEIVYIEKDGDVSINNPSSLNNGEQIELKEYSSDNDLTDSHLNFWNTLKNWTNPNFDSSKYKYLILATTQEIGVNSKFIEWNSFDYNERLKTLTNIYGKANTRYSTALKKNSKATKPEPLRLMDEIFKNSILLNLIIDKIIIDSNRTRRDKISDEIKEKHLKPFPLNSLDQVLNSLLGYVFRNEDYNSGWEISYSEFKTALEDLSSRYNNTSQLFPIHEDLKNIPDAEKERVLKYSFIKKIEEIEYVEVIPTSLNSYWFTINTIAREFETRKQKIETLKQFQDELIITHNTLYNKSSRSCSQLDLISKSKDFYDDIISGQVPNYDVYNNTPLIFKNGMYQLIADEDENIVWKLTPKSNE